MENKEQCNGCLYWQSLSGYRDRDHGCVQILYTGKRRKEKDGVCLSMEPLPDFESSEKTKQNKKSKKMV